MMSKLNNFEPFFKTISYLVVFCGFLSLWVSGSFGLFVTFLFLFVLVSAWFLEDTKWQISERWGTTLIVFIVPLFYIGWKYKIIGFASSENAVAEVLAEMILILAGIKVLQRKTEKDWIFLYVISFFEVLLAAGLSINPIYLASFILYLLVTICAVISFEIRKTSRSVAAENQPEKVLLIKESKISRLPLTAISLLLLIIVFAIPLFFILPRVGGAGLGGNKQAFSSVTGFSDSVKLGSIGSLKQNDEIVMRVRLEKKGGITESLYWRGIALDTFDDKVWSKSKSVEKDSLIKSESGTFLVNKLIGKEDGIVQTFYLEPIQTPVLFTLSHPLLVQGNFKSIYKDKENSLSFGRDSYERISYKVYSNLYQPDTEELKSDNIAYSKDDFRYLQFPADTDERIARLAAQITKKANNRYDKAKEVEKYLQTQFGYSLEMKAGGEQPLADFLFRVREGHCEYFASAMAIMLRTQGIATRVVNGFQQGEYNEMAGVYVVRQKDAHSWVEVYFPKENAWIRFDPTPFAGQSNGINAGGILGTFNSYLEAIETFWIQYFVSYDNQEQRSLFRSVKSGFSEYQIKTSNWLREIQYHFADWWKEVRGDKGLQSSAQAIGYGIAYLFAAIIGIFAAVILFRKIKRFELWKKIYFWFKFKDEPTIVEFYEKMQKLLAGKGFVRQPHQTPLEFAFALKMPEAVSITEKYNRVRFGEKHLSEDEAQEIEKWLKNLEKTEK